MAASSYCEGWTDGIVQTNMHTRLTITEININGPENQTTVSITFELFRPVEVESSSLKNWSCTVDGQTYSGSAAIAGSGTLTIYSGSKTINHNSGGDKTISFSSVFALGPGWNDIWNSANYNNELRANGSLALTDIRHTVAYHANGGTSAPSSQTKVYGLTLTLSPFVPVRPGYVFKGWATSSVSVASSYQPGGQYKADEDITLYAIWEIEPPKDENILIYKNSNACKAIEFIENSSPALKKGGQVFAQEFIESDSISITNTKMVFGEIIEK